MPAPDLLLAFFLASAIFAFVPGPSMVYAAARTLISGRRIGLWSAAGFHLAGLGHIAAAAFGISALLAVMPALFTAMKLVGAAYLIWLGLRYVIDPRPQSEAAVVPAIPTAGRALRDSFMVEALNPKSALFFLAFLPQFTDPAGDFPIWMQIAVLGGVVNAMFSATDLLLIELSHTLARRLPSSGRVLRALHKVGGGALIALGVNLALLRNP